MEERLTSVSDSHIKASTILAFDYKLYFQHITPQLHVIMVAKAIITALTSVLLLVDPSNAAACPFSEAHRAGLLDRNLADKFEAVQKDSRNADRLIGARHAGAKRQDPQQGGVAGLVGPIIDGVLNLPLGGGLCMFLYRLSD